MSTTIDNITLAIISLKQELENYLDDNQWNNNYNIVVAGDDSIRNKEIVQYVSDSRTQIGLPLLVMEPSFVRNEVQELGDQYGKDLITVTVILRANDQQQLVTLGNLIRRKCQDLIFDIKNYSSIKSNTLGTAEINNSVFDNISNYNSNELSERHVALLHFTMELTAQNLL